MTDAKWYAGYIRGVPASTADEKLRLLEAASVKISLTRQNKVPPQTTYSKQAHKERLKL